MNSVVKKCKTGICLSQTGHLIKQAGFDLIRGTENRNPITTDRIHGTGIFTYIYHTFKPNDPYPLDGGGRDIYVRYIFASKIPENMPSTFFQAILGKMYRTYFEVSMVHLKKNVHVHFSGIKSSSLKMYMVHFEVQPGKCTCTFFTLLQIIFHEQNGIWWNKMD